MAKEPWPDEHYEFLTQALQDGLSYTQIAAEIFNRYGITRSRGAIAGAANRVGAKTGKSPEDIAKEMRKHVILAQLKRAAQQRVLSGNPPTPKRKRSVPLDQSFNVPRTYVSDEDRLAIFQGVGVPLTERCGCCWPKEKVNGVQTFCNAKISKGSYCDFHHGAAYQHENPNPRPR